MGDKEIVRLAPGMTLVSLSDGAATRAIDLAHRVAMSPHEWTWTPDEQVDLAFYVLWAHQRLSGIKQLADSTQTLQLGGE